ncbi:Type IV secretory pathway, VirJ component [Rhizobium sp. RU20A]|uniref:virulence factor family protein n=1 Tax=Rhizobium sp. RU20A TaxID=1907412 RepID=UPI000953BD5D|nr:AcvB/VirJ family lysyl-phosphatidylglycerol hydrolase [Rhizobium sp. RU20A]SIQ08031.1 Type IV secretory pathway, VirJ component [Rhizobium sp. RU20A]
MTTCLTSTTRATLVAALLSGLCLVPFSAGAQDATTPHYDTGMIPGDHILLPENPPVANVVLISDGDGWNAAEQAEAEALIANDVAVIGIDFPEYLKALRADDGDCVYMISDVESLVHQVQRVGKAEKLTPPIVAGIGEGGALALAMIAQSPEATIGEAIAVDPLAGIPLAKQLCTPAEKTSVGDRMLYGLTDGALPAPVTVLFTAKASAEGKAHVASIVKDHPDVVTRDSDDDAMTTLGQALDDSINAENETQDPLGLPLSILETKPTMDTMAVIYSGDGGWRDLDREVGGALQDRGIPVVGVDSLRYFWSERKPQETADDLTRIIDTYRKHWHVKNVLLIGYSFGADVLPATYNLLPADDRDHVVLLSLLALSKEVDYVISVEGWLGVAGDGKAGNSLDDIAKIKPSLIQCIYGTEEDDDPCPSLKDKGIETLGIEGGHHFDEDYEALADKIVAALKARLTAAK